MIKVAVQNQRIVEVQHRLGMTLRDVLKEAGVEPSRGSTITVKGMPCKMRHPVFDGSLVVVTPKVVNG